MDDPDLDALRAILDGQEIGIRQLMERHKEAVFRYVYRYTRNAVDAEEITADTFVKVYFNAEKYRPKGKVRTWIFTIATNLCRDRYRKKIRFWPVSLDAGLGEDRSFTLKEKLSDSSADASAIAAEAEFEEQVHQAINRLPPKLKAPFVLFVLEEHSYQESAAILHCSEKAVETRIYRARKLLRQYLDQNINPK